MQSYFLFVTIAMITILSPGPGVLLTLSNSIRFGFTGAVGGILGIASGTLVVASVSATGLGLILAFSTIAFTIMKYIGAAYLCYLGIKLWRSAGDQTIMKTAALRSRKMRFVEGVTVQVTNPKAVFFFMSVFPQFIDYSMDFSGQFTVLVLTYSVLVVVIHMVYGIIAESIRHRINSPKYTRLINKVSGSIFICFGVGLATANK